MASTLRNEDYDAALAVFEKAIKAFCSGNPQRGDELLRTLDRPTIEQDRMQIRQLARQARPFQGERAGAVGKRTISNAVKHAVCQRDNYQCRFTARRLIETEVFKEVARISREFHFDVHHSVRATRRGPSGHPIVRTHGAAFEHAGTPHSHGGDTTAENLALISVELNEGKSNLGLPILAVSRIQWNGLTEYLPRLRHLPSAVKTPDNVLSSDVVKSPRIRGRKGDSGMPIKGSQESTSTPDGAAASLKGIIDRAPAIPKNADHQAFQAAFTRFWTFLIGERSSRREVVYSPYGGNPRRITRIAGDVMYLVEITKRAGNSSCTRIELRNDFAKLVNDPTWRDSSLQQVRTKHGIKNLIEFKRDMFDQFERDFLHAPAV